MNVLETAKRGLTEILAPVAEELAAVEARLHALVASPDDPPWLATAVTTLLEAGGKRVRPALVVLCAHAGSPGAPAVDAAAAVELLHLASLVHDDVIDGGRLRRGIPTINARCGDPLAILTGDYLFGKAVVALAGLPPAAVAEFGAVIGELVAGEVDQQLGRGEAPGLGQYLERIGQKTAALLATCCRLGALLGGAGPAEIDRLERYGGWFGLAYQVADDLLDVRGDADLLGKPVGMDLARGVTTLPNDQLAGELAARAQAELAGLEPAWLRQTLADLTIYAVQRRN
jgi:heptaprenyl diphosphate synthase